MSIALEERLRDVEVLVLDVDGVLTDGSVIYTDAGAQVQAFHVRDGAGLSFWKRSSKRIVIITGRGSAALDRRAAELKVDVVMQHITEKGAAFDSAIARLGVPPEQVCVVGDDLPDLPMMRRASVAVAVADAVPEVKTHADIVAAHPGGRGAVRETVERILKAQGLWAALVESFET